MAKGIADQIKQRINSLKLRHIFRPRYRHDSSPSPSPSSRPNSTANLTLKPNKGQVQLLDLMAFAAVFALSFIAGSFFLTPYDSQAVTGLTLVSPNASLTASVTPGVLSTDITPTASGTIVSTQQTITTNTDMPTGYNLSLEQTNTSANAAAALKPTTGTVASPTALSNNTWGFAISGVSSSTTSNQITNGFDGSYTTPSPSTSSKWANPAISSTIKDRRTATSDTGDPTTVYYAAKADLSAPVGVSSFTMRYTATTNVSLLPAPTITSITATSGPTQSTSTGSTAGGTPITIVGTGFANNDTSVTYEVKLGSDSCTGATISSNTPSAGQDTIYCTTPLHATAEAVTVTVGTWGGTATKASGFTYVAPTATITVPTNNTILSAGTTAQTITVTTDIPATCYYGTTTTPATKMSTTGNDTTGATTHSQNITGLTNESTHTYYIRCQAKTSHSYGANKSVTFYVRKATPTLSSITPTTGTKLAAGTTSQAIGITTNVAATCYYGTGSSPTTAMTTTGTTTHSQSITGLTNTTSHTYYIRCRTGSGNTISDYSSSSSTTFHVRTATPTVSITAPTADQIFAAGTTSTTLSVTTNTTATCYYGTATNPTTAMGTTNATSHSQSITSLSNASTNTRYVRCTSGSGNTISDYSSDASQTFYVKATTPTLSSITPTTGTILSAGTTSQAIGITTNVAATCYYGTGSTPTTAMSTTGSTTHSQSITTANATSYTYYIRCRVGSGNTISDYSSSSSTTFHVRTATPTVTISAPTASQIFAAGTTSTTLSVTTNTTSTCYYGTATNPTTAMGTTNATSHSQSITSLANASTNIRYVRCRTGSGNTISDYSSNSSVTFYVRAATPAAPTLTPASSATVLTGTTTITVTASGATCKWGTASGTYGNNSGTTRTTTTGTNTLYYSCTAGSGNTISAARTGSWSYTGVVLAVTGDKIQTVTTINCPTTTIRVNDARDNRSYWVKKIGNQCWMLTNLAYAGGGTNTYNDVKTITNQNALSYTAAYYMIPTGANPTSGTTNPSTSTNGGVTNPQYGYLYNFCAANGAQANTSACLDAETPAHNTSISICPSGWRLPTGGSTSADFALLNTNANSGSTSSPSGLFTNWYGMYSGAWDTGNFYDQGIYGIYWASTQRSGYASHGHRLQFLSDAVYLTNYYTKQSSYAVRCVAV